VSPSGPRVGPDASFPLAPPGSIPLSAERPMSSTPPRRRHRPRRRGPGRLPAPAAGFGPADAAGGRRGQGRRPDRAHGGRDDASGLRSQTAAALQPRPRLGADRAGDPHRRPDLDRRCAWTSRSGWPRRRSPTSGRRSPTRARTSSEPTEVRFLYDEDALYVGFWCWDRDGDIRTRLGRRDTTMQDVDLVRVHLDSYHDHRTSYSFSVTPSGAIRDIAAERRRRARGRRRLVERGLGGQGADGPRRAGTPSSGSPSASCASARRRSRSGGCSWSESSARPGEHGLVLHAPRAAPGADPLRPPGRHPRDQAWAQARVCRTRAGRAEYTQVARRSGAAFANPFRSGSDYFGYGGTRPQVPRHVEPDARRDRQPGLRAGARWTQAVDQPERLRDALRRAAARSSSRAPRSSSSARASRSCSTRAASGGRRGAPRPANPSTRSLPARPRSWARRKLYRKTKGWSLAAVDAVTAKRAHGVG
jgi:hypothetical protein